MPVCCQTLLPKFLPEGEAAVVSRFCDKDVITGKSSSIRVCLFALVWTFIVCRCSEARQVCRTHLGHLFQTAGYGSVGYDISQKTALALSF